MADARRQYITIFAVGGKILASFKGTMTAARVGMKGLQLRMKALKDTMAASGKSMVGTIGKITAAFGGLATLLGGLLLTNILGKIFSSSADEAIAANKRTRDLTASLQINAKIHGQAAKFTEEFTKRQIDLIYQHNKAIESQGVIAHASLDQFSALMAEMGFAPTTIMATSSAFADLLVKAKGLNATYEDGLELNEAIRKLIEFGQIKAMAKLFPQMTKADQQELKLIHTREDALRWLMKFANEYKGFNKKALQEAGGPLKRFFNMIHTIAEDIGAELLPAQDELAKTWTELLPILKPVLKIITDGMVRGIKSFAAWSKRSLTPENAKKFLDALSKVGDAIAWIARNAKWLVPTIIGLVVAFEALKVAIVLMNAALIATNVIMAISPVGWIIIGITALIGVLILAYVYWDKITAAISGAWDAMKKWPIIGPVLDALNKFWDWLKTIPVIGDVVKALEGFYKGLLKYMLNPIGTMKDLWDNLVKIMGADFWKQLVKDIEDTGAAIMKWLHKPIAAVTDATHTMMDTWRGRPKWLGGTGGGAAGAAQARANVQAAAAATAPAQKAAAQIPLAPEGLKAVQDERADIMQEMMRPELRNLISATMATEAGGIEDQKNVMEALVNRAVAAKRAGNYKGIESMIKGGFYGPYNRGETQAVMSKGLTDSRSQQVLGALTEIQQGRNALGGLTDQGMINEIKGAIKEQHGEDYYGMQGLPGEKESAAYKYSQAFREGGQVARAYADGGIASTPQIASLAEQGPEMVLPLRGAANKLGGLASKLGGVGGGTTNHVSFAPNITINGNATDAEQKAMDSRLRDLAKDFISQFKRAQAQERRLSYESGYA